MGDLSALFPLFILCGLTLAAAVAPDVRRWWRRERRLRRRNWQNIPTDVAYPVDSDDSCCARTEGHEGPCEWICSDCAGTGRCTSCEHEGCPCDDVVQCDWCDGLDRCPSCDEGTIADEVW